MKPEKDNAYPAAFGERQDFAKIKVKGYDDPSLVVGFFKDGAIGQTMEALFTQMHGVMALSPKPLYDSLGNSHIGQKSHAILSGIDLFLG